MKQIAGVIVVALTSVVNHYVGIPAGYGFDLSPAVIGIAAFVGSVGGTVALVFVGDRVMPRVRAARDRVLPQVREAYRRVRPGTDSVAEGEEEGGARTGEADAEADAEPSGRVRGIADRFGAPGIGLIGPLTIGGFASAVSGVALGYPKLKLAVWVGIGQGLVVAGYLLLLNFAVAN